MQNIDYFRSAQILIKEHGDSAHNLAAQRLQELLDLGDVKGAGVWLAIGQAIIDLTSSSGTKH